MNFVFCVYTFYLRFNGRVRVGVVSRSLFDTFFEVLIRFEGYFIVRRGV